MFFLHVIRLNLEIRRTKSSVIQYGKASRYANSSTTILGINVILCQGSLFSGIFYWELAFSAAFSGTPLWSTKFSHSLKPNGLVKTLSCRLAKAIWAKLNPTPKAASIEESCENQDKDAAPTISKKGFNSKVVADYENRIRQYSTP